MKAFLKHIFVLFIGSSPLMLHAQQSGPPGLTELIDSALNKDHMLANKRLDIEFSKIDRKKLSEVYLPNAEVSGKYAFLANGVNLGLPGTSLFDLISIPEINSGFTSSANLFKADLSLSSVLYAGGKVSALKSAVDAKTKAQTALLEKDRQQIITEISKAYDQLALLRQVKLLLDKSRDRYEINKKTADKALNYGLITKYEHQKVEVAQATLASKIQEYEGKRNLLLHQLEMFTGISLERLGLIENDLSPINTVSSQNTIANRPEFTALSAAIEAQGFKLKAAQTWWKPKVQAAASLGYLNLFDVDMKGKHDLPVIGRFSSHTNKIEVAPNFTVGIGFKWDIFDGNKGKREVQQARIEVKKAENEKAEAEEQLKLNLIKTQTDYNNSNSELVLKQKQRKMAENALTQAGKEFKTGLIKAADLIGAESDYQGAALDYLKAVFNQRRNAIELLKATGNLNRSTIQ
ncbi:Outer membrane protein TolC [Pedobacter steynii]|uniref:Outer membrane protein TolC n=1 Tax=Pedobacter steynii TaxID=430522 RepID=A0A1H0AXY1_9SPHI|nr:TolC family protein [Pedobacter steynii]NQX41229.1 TolC family protein [Pedobacter steynii]SDN38086.1 Outer membrane protein TolC [Pedobacter steynii]